MAVIFVAGDRPMDKQSILTSSNQIGDSKQCSSRLFEQFVARLGWEVNLNKHDYYAGGLANVSTTAPYYCTATTEILFHVSTRSMGDGDWTKKLRHIGNDEIHIVWCENIVDYRRNIIPTEFCDFLIVIYPLTNFRDDQSPALFRIQIDEKSSLNVESDNYIGGAAPIGPLFDGALVDWSLLAPLVRATALNASRAKKTSVTSKAADAHDFVEHRFEAFENLASKMENGGYQTSYNETIKKLWNIRN
uniref:Rap-GAP domain-containing protein n=1 Tax=Romanomermis culicivorax TaxID=13658 RepID=A0A915HSB3_ROMCU